MMSGRQALANASQVDTSHYHMGVYQEMMDRVVNKTDDIAALYGNIPSRWRLNLFSASADIGTASFRICLGFPLLLPLQALPGLSLRNVSKGQRPGVALMRHLDIPLHKDHHCGRCR